MGILSPPFALGAAGQLLSGRLLRLALGSAFRGAAAGVQGTSGVLAGAPNTMGELTLPSNVQLTVQPFRAVVQNTQDATGGQFLLVNDAAVNLAVTAQHATQWRKSLIVAYAADSVSAGVASSAATDKAALELMDGALAASSGAAALPATPANGLALGELLIPPTGTPVTVTPYNPRTTSRGGILPVVNDAAVTAGHAGAAPIHDGQVRHHPVNGLEVGIGAGWEHDAPKGLVGYFTTGANSALMNTATRTRLTGGLNGACGLRTGRVYEVEWHCALITDTANAQAEVTVSIADAAATPAVGDLVLASAADTIPTTGGGGQRWVVIKGWFRVTTSKQYLLSPWLRRSGGAGNVQSIVNGNTALQTIVVRDLGSIAYVTANVTQNLGTVPLVTA